MDCANTIPHHDPQAKLNACEVHVKETRESKARSNIFSLNDVQDHCKSQRDVLFITSIQVASFGLPTVMSVPFTSCRYGLNLSMNGA